MAQVGKASESDAGSEPRGFDRQLVLFYVPIGLFLLHHHSDQRGELVRKVLVLEDDPGVQQTLTLGLPEHGLEPLIAGTVEKARGFLNLHWAHLFAITCDANLGGEKNSLGFVREASEVFRGHIIACSTSPAARKMLVNAGCTCECEKGGLLDKLIELAGRTPG